MHMLSTDTRLTGYLQQVSFNSCKLPHKQQLSCCTSHSRRMPMLKLPNTASLHYTHTLPTSYLHLVEVVCVAPNNLHMHNTNIRVLSLPSDSSRQQHCLGVAPGFSWQGFEGRGLCLVHLDTCAIGIWLDDCVWGKTLHTAARSQHCHQLQTLLHRAGGQ